MEACRKSHVKTIAILIASGVDATLKNNSNQDALDCCQDETLKPSIENILNEDLVVIEHESCKYLKSSQTLNVYTTAQYFVRFSERESIGKFDEKEQKIIFNEGGTGTASTSPTTSAASSYDAYDIIGGITNFLPSLFASPPNENTLSQSNLSKQVDRSKFEMQKGNSAETMNSTDPDERPAVPRKFKVKRRLAIESIDGDVPDDATVATIRTTAPNKSSPPPATPRISK